MKKILLLLLVLAFFFQSSADANALCTVGCKLNGPADNLKCYYQTPNSLGTSVYSTCMINPQSDYTTTAWSYGSSCSKAGNICQSNGCPTSSQDGASCKVLLPCVSGSSCSADEGNGKWDASESKCVKCDAVVTQKESKICGDSSGIYLGASEGSYAGTNLPCRSDYDCSKPGNKKFESACGADAACDEKVEGNSCGTDKACDANGKCETPIVPICTASLSLDVTSPSPGCTVTPTVNDASAGCNGKSFEIKTESTSKCSGIISGSSGTCTPSSWSISSGTTYTYKLYVGGDYAIPKDTESATCGAVSPPITECSGLNMDACNNDANCKWCGNFEANVCVKYGETCPSASCSGKTQSQCTGVCSWCSNTISGGSYAGGGVCYASSDLSTSCGGCYKTGTYSIPNHYAYCSGGCPGKASEYGYYGGWCTGNNIGVGDCSSAFYGQKCNCKGNLFNTAKNNDGIANCGECAINVNGNDCGGTAASGKETDNTYLVNYYYTQPAGLSGTKVYTDAASWKCSDVTDNDRDCLVDCDDPDCSSALICAGKSPKQACGGVCGSCPSGQACVYGTCQPAGTIQGYKIDVEGASFNTPGATITVSGVGTYGPSVNPYIASVTAGAYNVQSSVPAGYSVSYSLCNNCMDHPSSSYVSGSQVTVNVPSGDYADLWWKYTSMIPKGWHDSSVCSADSVNGWINGWACDPDNYNQAIDIRFYRDGPKGTGVFMGSASANQARADVAAECGGNPSHGFSYQFSVPPSMRDGLPHEIYAYAINIGSGDADPLLSGSPKSITCASDAPPSVEEVSHSPENPKTTNTVTVKADASDDIGLTKIEVYTHGLRRKTCDVSGRSASCQYSSTYPSAGTYSYWAVATDTKSQSTTSPTKYFTVTAPSFDFSLSVSPSSGSVMQGSSTSATVTATLESGATQKVDLSCLKPPAGVACSFSPSSLYPTGSSILTITTSAEAAAGSRYIIPITPAGTHKITIVGKNEGVTRTVNYDLVVTALPSAECKDAFDGKACNWLDGKTINCGCKIFTCK